MSTAPTSSSLTPANLPCVLSPTCSSTAPKTTRPPKRRYTASFRQAVADALLHRPSPLPSLLQRAAARRPARRRSRAPRARRPPRVPPRLPFLLLLRVGYRRRLRRRVARRRPLLRRILRRRRRTLPSLPGSGGRGLPCRHTGRRRVPLPAKKGRADALTPAPRVPCSG